MHLKCGNSLTLLKFLPLNKLYGSKASFQTFQDPIFSWSNFPLWFFKMIITTGTAWVVNESVNKMVSPLEDEHGFREDPVSARRVVDFLSLQCLTEGTMQTS